MGIRTKVSLVLVRHNKIIDCTVLWHYSNILHYRKDRLGLLNLK